MDGYAFVEITCNGVHIMRGKLTFETEALRQHASID